MLCTEQVKSAQGRNTASVFGSSARDEMSQTRTRCIPRVRRDQPCGLITVTDSETLSFKSPVICHWSNIIEL